MTKNIKITDVNKLNLERFDFKPIKTHSNTNIHGNIDFVNTKLRKRKHSDNEETKLQEINKRLLIENEETLQKIHYLKIDVNTAHNEILTLKKEVIALQTSNEMQSKVIKEQKDIIDKQNTYIQIMHYCLFAGFAILSLLIPNIYIYYA